MFIETKLKSKFQGDFDEKLFKLFPFSYGDENFVEFIKKYKGGYFFENSLHFFSFTNSNEDLLNIKNVNDTIKSMYKDFVVFNYEYFSQDIFGNLFFFSDEGVGFLEIETGNQNILAQNFLSFDNLMSNDFEYLTGINYLKDWETQNNKSLEKSERLCPKIPFVLNGEYTYKNLYSKNSFKNWEFNIDLAKQLKDVPDGTPFEIRID